MGQVQGHTCKGARSLTPMPSVPCRWLAYLGVQLCGQLQIPNLCHDMLVQSESSCTSIAVGGEWLSCMLLTLFRQMRAIQITQQEINLLSWLFTPAPSILVSSFIRAAACLTDWLPVCVTVKVHKNSHCDWQQVCATCSLHIVWLRHKDVPQALGACKKQ